MKDLEQSLLKLVWQQFSTTQIHHLLRQFPTFLTADHYEQCYMLEQFKYISTKSNLQFKLQMFKRTSTDEIMTYFQQLNINYLSIFNDAYPHFLKQIYDFPFVLFYQGQLQILQHYNTLAIIGSRQAGSYTKNVLNHFFPEFANHQLTIVSGLAIGADSFAHQFALKHHLPTVAVLAFGHEHHYPNETLLLRQQIAEQGIVISEYMPKSSIAKYRFPERNRLISGLSKGIFITEAKERSGSHITIDCALEQNRNVYVLPGSIFNPLTRGNLLKIQEGAKVVIDVKDIIEDYL
ncbi:DNA-processing protein DprA [Staphylococcus simiae]|uniref:DNA processing protein n=1 Tax=Staphylococcus simiae CCM 7213 = CCUG 51256 TaxID=911238 RepID=G5JLM6_9STAP|nr:DNA-processing protein DprA [Staphylococcus simiae]EHJ06906.1 DNA processing protein [Staphylococcus simiae CCM 7213 = CCUG 51256]PNZ12979.1 DNA-protecting protein DprA [Staphylococcus simiae]SNV69402.1 DNA processing protein [Staphylococcus simiae]